VSEMMFLTEDGAQRAAKQIAELFDGTLAAERQRIAAYVEAQLLGEGRDAFDVVLKPSLVRAVAEDIRSGRYES